MTNPTDFPSGNIVQGLKKFGHSPDFSEADFTFQMHGGAGLTLRMDQKVLADTAKNLTETCLYLESRRSTTTGHTAILALDAIEASAVSPAGGSAVILRLKVAGNREYTFALPVALAASLWPQMQQAAQSAQKEAKETRQ